jgi:hypothetical protein
MIDLIRTKIPQEICPKSQPTNKNKKKSPKIAPKITEKEKPQILEEIKWSSILIFGLSHEVRFQVTPSRSKIRV